MTINSRTKWGYKCFPMTEGYFFKLASHISSTNNSCLSYIDTGLVVWYKLLSHKYDELKYYCMYLFVCFFLIPFYGQALRVREQELAKKGVSYE